MGQYSYTFEGKDYAIEAPDDATAGAMADAAIAQRKAQGTTTPTTAKPAVVTPGEMQTVTSPEIEARMAGAREGAGFTPGQSGALGAGQGLLRNFGDEVASLSEASGLPTWAKGSILAPVIGGARLALSPLTGDEGAVTRQREALAKARGIYQGSSEANPIASAAGEFAGGVIGPGAKTLKGNVAVGAGEGALSGAGSGEDLTGSAAGAAIGGAAGGVLGGIASKVADTLGGAVQGLRGLYGGKQAAQLVEEKAKREVNTALQRDLARLSPEELAEKLRLQQEAVKTGQAGEQVVADTGGQATQELLRTSTNISPDALADAKKLVYGRFSEEGTGQQSRFMDWWGRLTGGPNSTDAREALHTAARRENAPAYRKAYEAPNAQGIWDYDLQTLTSTPQLQKAIKEATDYGKAYTALEGGRQAPVNPFKVGPDGAMTLPEGVTPNLQFWDIVQRRLRAQETSPSISDEDKRLVTGLRKQLTERLDATVPEFKDARAGAARFFGAEDALDAGTKFLQNPNLGQAEAKQALAKMTAAERELFRDGLTESVNQQVKSLGPNQDVSKLFQSPELKERLVMGLGPQRATELQTFMTIERGMDQLRGALGNSTTARQLLATGAFGAGGAGLAGGTSLLSGDTWTETGAKAAIATAISGGLKHGNQRLASAAADRVAQLLLSKDPVDLRTVATMVQKNPVVGDAVRSFMSRISSAAGQTAGSVAGEGMSGQEQQQ